jgi:hypothetical protein
MSIRHRITVILFSACSLVLGAGMLATGLIPVASASSLRGRRAFGVSFGGRAPRAYTGTWAARCHGPPAAGPFRARAPGGQQMREPSRTPQARTPASRNIEGFTVTGGPDGLPGQKEEVRN